MNINKTNDIICGIPVQLIEEDGEYMIFNNELGIYVQDSNEIGAKILFKRCLKIYNNRKT